MARRGKDLSHPHIHPGHLIQPLSGRDQAVGFHVDAKMSALHIALYDALHHRIHLLHKGCIPGFPEIQVHTVDKEQGRVCRIVHGLVSALRKQVGHQAVPLIHRKGAQDAFGRFVSSCAQTDAGESDHGVPSPILKKGITRQNGFPFGGIPSGNELIRSCGEGARRF